LLQFYVPEALKIDLCRLDCTESWSQLYREL
jgi:hypothetical protein